MPIGTFAGIAAATGLIAIWHGWKRHRNSLPDDVRSSIFWNDQRYQRLQAGLTIAAWLAALASALIGLWVIGIVNEWWRWPYQ